MKFWNVYVDIRCPQFWKGDICLGIYTMAAEHQDGDLYKSFNIGVLIFELSFYSK